MFLEQYSTVVITGEPVEFDAYIEEVDKYFSISVVKYDSGKFAAIFFEITDRKRAEETIHRQVVELESKNSELERFTYTVSHDLRSPLITIKGFAGALMKDISLGKYDRAVGDMSRIVNASDKMQELLQDLLELSRIGRMINPSSDFSMTDIGKEVCELLHGPINSQRVDVSVAHDMPVVHADRQRIKEVIQNLIENSIKFIGQQKNPSIEVGCSNINNEIVYFVKDNGIGIDKKYHQNIFGLFNKLDQQTDGTGIGLALVKRIVELHDGRIWLESSIGKGTTFFFTIGNFTK